MDAVFDDHAIELPPRFATVTVVVEGAAQLTASTLGGETLSAAGDAVAVAVGLGVAVRVAARVAVAVGFEVGPELGCPGGVVAVGEVLAPGEVVDVVSATVTLDCAWASAPVGDAAVVE